MPLIAPKWYEFEQRQRHDTVVANRVWHNATKEMFEFYSPIFQDLLITRKERIYGCISERNDPYRLSPDCSQMSEV